MGPSTWQFEGFLGCIRDSGLYNWLLLAMITMNLPHGPDSTDMRFMQVKDAMVHCFQTHTSSSCELFQEHLPGLLLDVAADLPEYEDGMTTDERAWRFLEEHSAFQKKGEKVNLTRFHSVVKEGREFVKRWTSTLVQCEYVSLEMDMLKGKKFTDKVTVKMAGRDPDAPDTTAATATALDDRALRSCCQNSVVIALMFLSEDLNLRLMHMVVSLAGPVTLWHSAMEKQVRSVASASSWLLDQVSGGFCKHVTDIWRVLSDDDFMKSSGLLHFQERDVVDLSDGRLFNDEEISGRCGSFALCLMSKRCRRCLWMTSGYPVALARLISDKDDVAAVSLAQLKSDWETWVLFKDLDRPSKDMLLVRNRSAFNLLAVEQIVLGLVESGYS